MQQNVLIIEDDKSLAEVEKRFFERYGLAVQLAASAEDALVLLRGDTLPSLLVIDYRLPGMSGVDFLKKVKEMGLKIPSVILTGAGDEHVAVSAMKLGAMEYLVKDIEAISKLPETCLGVIRNFELEQEKERLTEELKNVNRELMEANRRLEELTIRDELTGAYNRRAMMESLEHGLLRYRLNGFPLSVAILDLDGFKEINDTMGHLAGDVVLRQFSSLVSDRIRRTDLLCRYGGDEFAVVFENTAIEGAAKTCRTLLTLVEGYSFGDEKSDIRLTFSAGVSCLKDGVTIEGLLDAADKSLYKAKAGGKGMVFALQLQGETESG